MKIILSIVIILLVIAICILPTLIVIMFPWFIATIGGGWTIGIFILCLFLIAGMSQ
jgi:hypothetical protein